MLRTVFSILIICSFSFVVKSSDTKPSDSISYFYEFEMKYNGSNFQVDENYQYVLSHLVELLNKDTTLRVHIRGHVCCGPGIKLSKKRAKKVYKYLLRSGICKTRLSYKGYSNTAPLIFPEKEEEDEMANRRVDFVIYYFVPS